MKRLLTVFLLIAALVAVMAFATACSGDDDDAVATPAPQEQDDPPATQDDDVEEDDPVVEVTEDADAALRAAHGLDENLRFYDTVQLSTVVWDRGNERMPDMDDNGWTEWMQAELLATHNIDLSFHVVPRWDQHTVIATLVGAGSAPDVSFHFNGPAMTNTFAEMGALLDLTPYLATYGHWLPNMYDWLGHLVYYNRNPETGRNFAISSRRTEIMRQSTFIREDWLNTLGLPVPTTMQEFEDALVAFRDNAELLLGDDADMMIPMALGSDVGWGMGTLIEAFIPDNITEREWFVYGFCGRHIMRPTTKEAIRVANRWYNEGLTFQEFAYGEAGDLMGDFIRLGFVGAQIANWDMPFRAGADQQIVTMREHHGPDANFIPIVPFPNDSGNPMMIAFSDADRHIVFPDTNANPVASLLYLDWLSRQSTRDFMAFGHEGIHHIVEANGAKRILPGDDLPDDMLFASVHNFDMMPVSNGFLFPDHDVTINTLALAYAGIEPSAIMHARQMAMDAARVWRTVVVRPIEAQEGMTAPLEDARDIIFHNAVLASVEDFDAVWDRHLADYMALGGAAIIAEREQAWVETFGDVDWMPGWEGW